MHHENLLEYLGRYQDRKVYKGAKSSDNVPDKESIYLVSQGRGRGHYMYINKKLVGYCDDQYAVEWFREPEEDVVEELTFTATPKPQPEPAEPKPQPTPATSAPASEDFWTRIQKEIADVLNSAAI